MIIFFFQAEDGIRDLTVTGVQTCALPIFWTISAGNAGQGVAYAARQAGVRCTVVAIETAPSSKLERMKALGARLVLVPYSVAWKALEERSFRGVEGTFVHPFDDHNFIAGHATMGLEILEDVPDTAAVIAGIGGGGPITGAGEARIM